MFFWHNPKKIKYPERIYSWGKIFSLLENEDYEKLEQYFIAGHYNINAIHDYESSPTYLEEALRLKKYRTIVFLFRLGADPNYKVPHSNSNFMSYLLDKEIDHYGLFKLSLTYGMNDADKKQQNKLSFTEGTVELTNYLESISTEASLIHKLYHSGIKAYEQKNYEQAREDLLNCIRLLEAFIKEELANLGKGYDAKYKTGIVFLEDYNRRRQECWEIIRACESALTQHAVLEQEKHNEEIPLLSSAALATEPSRATLRHRLVRVHSS